MLCYPKGRVVTKHSLSRMSRALTVGLPGWRGALATQLPLLRGGPVNTVTTCSVIQGGRRQTRWEAKSSSVASRGVEMSFIANRGLFTSAVRRSDEEKAQDVASMAQKVDPKDAAAKKAAEEATKKALERKKIADAKAAEKAKEDIQAAEAAAAKRTLEEKAAKKAAEEKAAKEAAAKKKAQEKAAKEAAAKKAAEEKAAKKAAEEKAAAKKAAEEKAAKKAAEE